MPFWTYMLHCRGGCFYVGHTDDLVRRVGEHKSGLIAGFTADHLPVELVWSQEFQTREDAKGAEAKLKGWSRAKKLALIRGDWERISSLAKNKDSASTSSAWTGEGDRMPNKAARPEHIEGRRFSLRPHPDTPPSRVFGLSARIWMTDGNELLIEYRVDGPEGLLAPDPVSPARRDGLWQTTCFELFLMREDGSYFEFNLSPSNEWAAYGFDSYRSGMRLLGMDIDPHIETRRTDRAFLLEADIDLGSIPEGRLVIALSAVIEEEGGVKSYWALVHPQGKPDFHHPACFAATLPAPSKA